MTQTATERPAPRPVTERGYASEPTASGWWQDLTNEETPELRWPFSVNVYDRMRRQDSQVGGTMRAVKSPILRTNWRVDGTGCREEVTRYVANQLGLPVDGDDTPVPKMRGRNRFMWQQHLRLALLELDFGHSFFEQVYYPPDEQNEFYRLRKLAPRLPRTIARVNVARDGGLVSIEQYGYGMTLGSPPLPVNRLVAYVNEREGANWLGLSLLRSAYKNWLLKDRALRTWSTSIDRNGIGIPIYTESGDGSKTERAAEMDAGEDLAQGMRTGENAGGAIPKNAKLDLMGVTGTLPDIDKFVRYQDEQIARSALGHFLNLGSQTHGQVGSYNLGSVLSDTFHDSLEVVADGLGETADAHVIEDIVDINFGPNEPAPTLVRDPIGVKQSELDQVRAAAGLSSDADLAKFLRQHQEAA